MTVPGEAFWPACGHASSQWRPREQESSQHGAEKRRSSRRAFLCRSSQHREHRVVRRPVQQTTSAGQVTVSRANHGQETGVGLIMGHSSRARSLSGLISRLWSAACHWPRASSRRLVLSSSRRLAARRLVLCPYHVPRPARGRADFPPSLGLVAVPREAVWPGRTAPPCHAPCLRRRRCAVPTQRTRTLLVRPDCVPPRPLAGSPLPSIQRPDLARLQTALGAPNRSRHRACMHGLPPVLSIAQLTILPTPGPPRAGRQRARDIFAVSAAMAHGLPPWANHRSPTPVRGRQPLAKNSHLAAIRLPNAGPYRPHQLLN